MAHSFEILDATPAPSLWGHVPLCTALEWRRIGPQTGSTKITIPDTLGINVLSPHVEVCQSFRTSTVLRVFSIDVFTALPVCGPILRLSRMKCWIRVIIKSSTTRGGVLDRTAGGSGVGWNVGNLGTPHANPECGAAPVVRALSLVLDIPQFFMCEPCVWCCPPHAGCECGAAPTVRAVSVGLPPMWHVQALSVHVVLPPMST